MATIIRPELSKQSAFYISRHRYYELRHFCQQYPEWRERLQDLDGFLAKKQRAGHIPSPGDPTAMAAEQRLFYIGKMEKVENAARRVCPTLESFHWLLDGVTNGCTYEILQARAGVPSFSRDAYYRLYRMFFWQLDKLRDS